VRARRRGRADSSPRASAAAPADTAPPATGSAPAEPPWSPGAFETLAERIDERDRPILAMLLAGDHPDEMARVTGLSAEVLGLRVRALVARLGTARAGRAPRSMAPAG
jgi:hypothetical protein